MHRGFSGWGWACGTRAFRSHAEELKARHAPIATAIQVNGVIHSRHVNLRTATPRITSNRLLNNRHAPTLQQSPFAIHQ